MMQGCSLEQINYAVGVNGDIVRTYDLLLVDSSCVNRRMEKDNKHLSIIYFIVQ